MPRKPVSPLHQWVGAAIVEFDHPRTAIQGNRHGRIKVDVDTSLDILDVYCSACRRTMDDVGDAPCEAAKSNAHLIGGPVGTRKKRVHDDHDCTLFGCDPSAAELAELRRIAATGHRAG